MHGERSGPEAGPAPQGRRGLHDVFAADFARRVELAHDAADGHAVERGGGAGVERVEQRADRGALAILALSQFGKRSAVHSRIDVISLASIVAIGLLSVAVAYWKVRGYA